MLTINVRLENTSSFVSFPEWFTKNYKAIISVNFVVRCFQINNKQAYNTKIRKQAYNIKIRKQAYNSSNFITAAIKKFNKIWVATNLVMGGEVLFSFCLKADCVRQYGGQRVKSPARMEAVAQMRSNNSRSCVMLTLIVN